jgi:hypothetical protein
MNPVQYSQTGTGAGRAILMDWLQNPFNVGGNVRVTGAAADFRVQHTFDDVLNPAVTPTWFNNSAFAAINAADKDWNYAFPVRAIRLNVIDGTGGGTVTISIIQASNAP